MAKKSVEDVADPEEVWKRIDEGDRPDWLCHLQRQVLARHDPGLATADLVYRRIEFELVDGRIVWLDNPRSLRVSVTPDSCRYLWGQDGT